jgi:glucokinase
MINNYFLIDAGGTQYKLGFMSGGQLVKTTSLPSHSGIGIKQQLPKIEALINEWMDESKLQGIGIAFAGIVDYDHSKVISVNGKFPDAEKFDFSKWAASKYGCRLAMENDARAALIGEWQGGAGRGYKNVVMLTLGTGIGSSAVINGNVLRGKHFQAGCLIGHFTIDYNGNLCNCGNKGCVETVGSSWILPKLVKDHALYNKSSISGCKLIDFEAIFDEAGKGDELALHIRENCMRSWGAAAVNAIHAYDPEIVVLGGGVMKSASTIIPFIQNYINEFAWTPWGKVQIKEATLGNEAALWGMNYLIEEKTNSI